MTPNYRRLKVLQVTASPAATPIPYTPPAGTVALYDLLGGSAYQDTGLTTPSCDGDPIRALKDLIGSNHLLMSGAGAPATLVNVAFAKEMLTGINGLIGARKYACSLSPTLDRQNF